ncbi:transmembrane protein 66 [Monascus purpureus]|uniref:Store-operated calcium entry-associated regulatory factor n=1 Tax=Monascus purpureus TaxID=5098 RepID=A0A507QP88_MONPU|nr:transmembrane protein 66 [Monascus purpureus]BDD61844.1 hypothetical protein MAP00_006868 [Monascus purpureus]
MYRHLATSLSILLCLFLVSPVLSKYGTNDRFSQERPPGRDAILLSNVKALTLRANRLTTSRRVAPIPQLTCTGPSRRICNLYKIDTMRCTNAGYDYDEEDVQWTCTAQLPPEFKLGSTDVVCEGYRSADDKWVLKGSCGVEYRLLLTDRGERQFGDLQYDFIWPWKGSRSTWSNVIALLGDLLFFGFVAAVLILIILPMLADCLGIRRGGRRGPRAGRGWGGWGGGGPDNDGYPRGPPPPYGCDDSNAFASRASPQGWRPGFWTGALGGAALGYELGRNRGRGSPIRRTARVHEYDYDNSVGGSSRSAPRFSSTSTSTGFGSTRRR